MRSLIYPKTISKAPEFVINEYEQAWGRNYRDHPLSDFVSFVPSDWLSAIGSRKSDLASNGLDGVILSGQKLNENLCREGMAHPIIISVNGVGDDIKVRLDCGQHRARIAHLVAGVQWLPCFVEVSHGKSAFIRSNGPHEYQISPEALLRKPDIKAQFMRPDALFSRFDIQDIEGAYDYLRSIDRAAVLERD